LKFEDRVEIDQVVIHVSEDGKCWFEGKKKIRAASKRLNVPARKLRKPCKQLDSKSSLAASPSER